MSRPTISLEFFPPKTLQASFRLWDCVQSLAPLDPTFVSVTYGAGGTTRKLTHEAVEALTQIRGCFGRFPPSSVMSTGETGSTTLHRTLWRHYGVQY